MWEALDDGNRKYMATNVALYLGPLINSLQPHVPMTVIKPRFFVQDFVDPKVCSYKEKMRFFCKATR